MIVLKIKCPSFEAKTQALVQALRTFRFSKGSSLREAILKVCEKNGIPTEAAQQYGFFIPSFMNGTVSGWLNLDMTWEETGLESGAEVDFRRASGRKIRVWEGKLESSVETSWNDRMSIKENLPAICREFGRHRFLNVMPPVVNKRVVILNKNDQLLNYPLPERSEFILSVQEGWKYTAECSDADLLENVYFFVLTPYLEGELWRKAATGFRRGWKKVWCVLHKETLAFYPEQGHPTPLGGVHLRNMEFCYQSEPIDAQSKKMGGVFKVGTTGQEKVVYLGVSQKSKLPQWVNTVTEWIQFGEFFKPKAISERGVALSHILSGQQIRPNPKTQTESAADDTSSSSRRSSAARQSVLEDMLPSAAGLEVQPNREVLVDLADGTSREMVVDSRLDVYELAYMIAEEIQSENAFIISSEDFGSHRQVELLDHQRSLASQQIPLSAHFSVRKTGIVDDFVKVNDIYDNHFLFVELPSLSSDVLCQNEAGEWVRLSLIMYAGKLCALDENSDVRHVVPMGSILSVYPSEVLDEAAHADYAFTVELTQERELRFLSTACEEWCDLDGWCGFRCNSPLMDPTETMSWRLYEVGLPLADGQTVAQFLNIPSDLSGSTGSVLSPRLEEPSTATSVSPPPEEEDGSGSISFSDETDSSPSNSSVAISPPPPASPSSVRASSTAAASPLGTSYSVLPSPGNQARIKQFDWRKGKQSDASSSSTSSRGRGGTRGGGHARRRSVDELFMAGDSDDDEDEEAVEEVKVSPKHQQQVTVSPMEDDSESAALRVPSDEEETSLDTATQSSEVVVAAAAATTTPMKLESRPSSGQFPDGGSNSNNSSGDTAKEAGGPPSKPVPRPPDEKPRPQQDVSRLIRRAYESVEPVKLKALPDNDPSLYVWKVLHSMNLQKLGYASARALEVVFFDLRGHEVLRVQNSDLPGLQVPASRLQRVEAALKQMRKSSSRDVRSELQEMYDLDGDDTALMRRARNAEFEFRVVSKRDGDQLGWASRRGLNMQCFDMNGKLLRSLPADLLGPAVLTEGGGAAPRRVGPADVRSLFNTAEQVHVVLAGEGERHDYKVLMDDGTHVGWGEQEAFDFSFSGLDDRVLGRMPLSVMPPALKALVAQKQDQQPTSMAKKRSSSGVGTSKGSRKGKTLKEQAQEEGSTVAGRPLSGWQLKIRNSGPFKSPTTSTGDGSASASPRHHKIHSSKSSGALNRRLSDVVVERRARGDSVDYTPDGLSPGLEDSVKAYDPVGKHRPMGLAGLLGEPDDSEEEK